MDKFLQYGVLIATAIVAVQSLKYADCGSKAKISKVTVTDCDATPACELKQGSTYTISVDFTPAEAVTSATTAVHGVISGIPIPFPIDNTNACKDCGLTCPLTSGKSVSYHADIVVKSSYPEIKVIVKWEVKDQNGDDLVCITLPAQIVAGKLKEHNEVLKQQNHAIPIGKKDTALRYKKFL